VEWIGIICHQLSSQGSLFFEAFGIDPEEQLIHEEYYRSLTWDLTNVSDQYGIDINLMRFNQLLSV